MPSAVCVIDTCWGSRESKHRFPNPAKYRDTFNKWVLLCGNKRLVKEMNPTQIYNNCRVCSLHFGQDDFGPNKRLKTNVLPSLRLTVPLPSNSIPWGIEAQKNITLEPIAGPSSRDSFTETIVEPIAGPSSINISFPEVVQIEEDASQKSNPLLLSTPKKRSKLLSEVNVSTVKDLTPKAKHLYQRALQFKKRSCKSKKLHLSLKERMKQAEKFTSSKMFEKVVSSMDRIRARFFESQVENSKRKPKGRRYTLEDKVLALALYKQSGSGYRFLSKLFALPSRKTVMKLLNRIPIKPGLHNEVFNVLKVEAKHFKNPLDKHCILMFDEMSIQAHLQPNIREGSVDGFEDFGYKKTDEIANHAQVFMVRGIRRKWKQPIFYNFVKGGTKKFDLVHIIRMIVRKCHSIGLNVVATVCDQGANNQAAINRLVQDTHDSHKKRGVDKYEYNFEVDGRQIIPLFDVPHLFKGLRNMLLKYNLHFVEDSTGKLARWDDIYTAYKMDPYLGNLRLMPKITDSHVNPERINKMKVAKCTQVFSHSVAAAINVFAFSGTTVETEEEVLKLRKEAADTASLLEFLDQLFDSLNGSSFKSPPGKDLRAAVTNGSSHLRFWNQALDKLRTFNFIKNGSFFAPPSLKNLIKTLSNFKDLFGIMKNLGFSYMMPRTFNQDPIENFFGKIRQRGQRNINPTSTDFSQYYKSLLVNGLTSKHSVGANCEDDKSEVFLTLQRLVSQGLPEEDEPSAETYCDVPNEVPQLKGPIESKVLKYVCGYLCKKVRKQPCCSNLMTQKSLEDKEDDEFLNFKEYKTGQIHLKYVNNEILQKMKKALSLIKFIFNRNLFKPGVFQFTHNLLCERIKFSNCLHNNKLQTVIFNYFLKINIFNYSNQLNRILRGLDQRVVPKTAPKIFLNAKQMYVSGLKRKKAQNKNRFSN